MRFFYTDNEMSDTERKRSAVFQAIGAASTCWESLEETGVFDSDRALEIGEALIQELGI